jgi:hypothetical protein
MAGPLSISHDVRREQSLIGEAIVVVNKKETSDE